LLEHFVNELKKSPPEPISDGHKLMAEYEIAHQQNGGIPEYRIFGPKDFGGDSDRWFLRTKKGDFTLVTDPLDIKPASIWIQEQQSPHNDLLFMEYRTTLNQNKKSERNIKTLVVYHLDTSAVGSLKPSFRARVRGDGESTYIKGAAEKGWIVVTEPQEGSYELAVIGTDGHAVDLKIQGIGIGLLGLGQLNPMPDKKVKIQGRR
jgi:hypothetical protein